jgi:hypothetical protein
LEPLRCHCEAPAGQRSNPSFSLEEPIASVQRLSRELFWQREPWVASLPCSSQ